LSSVLGVEGRNLSRACLVAMERVDNVLMRKGEKKYEEERDVVKLLLLFCCGFGSFGVVGVGRL